MSLQQAAVAGLIGQSADDQCTGNTGERCGRREDSEGERVPAQGDDVERDEQRGATHRNRRQPPAEQPPVLLHERYIGRCPQERTGAEAVGPWVGFRR